MCTYILHHDSASENPLIVATTREDYPARPTRAPFLWNKPDHIVPYVKDGRLKVNFKRDAYLGADIVAAQDEKFGGTYIGINGHGVFAALNNRENLQDPGQKLSRGGITLDALTFPTARSGAMELYDIICGIQKESAQPRYTVFNLIIADGDDAYVIMNAKKDDFDTFGAGLETYQDLEDFSIGLVRLPAKKTVFVAGYDVNDLKRSKRTQKFLPLYEGLAFPSFGRFDSWGGWLSPMVHRAEDGNPFDYSIAQPDPAETDGKGDPAWVTIGTSLVHTHRKGGVLDYEWHYGEGPPRFGKMDFEEVGRGRKKGLTVTP